MFVITFIDRHYFKLFDNLTIILKISWYLTSQGRWFVPFVVTSKIIIIYRSIDTSLYNVQHNSKMK